MSGFVVEMHFKRGEKLLHVILSSHCKTLRQNVSNQNTVNEELQSQPRSLKEVLFYNYITEVLKL